MRKSADSRYSLALAAALLVLSLPLSADVQVQLDRNRITEGETVTLTFQTEDTKQNLETDFSPLEQDFEILDRRSETQLSIVNGRQTAVVRLVLTVEPRHAGKLTIPAIDFGTSQTRSFTIQVDKAPELQPGALPPVFIEVEVTPEQGPYYVHAQLGLIVRVFYQQNLTEAAISQPEPNPGSVRLLQETPYQAERGGERYRVLERKYAIFPERSGELTLPAMQLSGRLVERGNGNIWQPTVRGRRIEVSSEPLQLHIDPRPAAFTSGDWQPARSLNLSQQISGSDVLRVGEPVTRTVIIDAIGLEENMIAEPKWPELPGVRIYPDQPQGISRDDGDWVLGHKEFRYAVVPEHEGELVLPELKVEWWDTTRDRQQTAVLPAQTVYVKPSTLVPPAQEIPEAAPAETGVAAAPARSAPAGQGGYWRWLTLLFAALWLLTLLAFWRVRERRGAAGVDGILQGRARDESGVLDGLRQACEHGDATAARNRLQAWLRQFGPGAGGSLLEFAAACGDPSLREAIYALDSQGFRKAPDPATNPAGCAEGNWNSREFWGQFQAWRRSWRALEQGRKAPLTDLYAPANRPS